ncbi:hypothetical protein BC833DRAFT_600864 [Globomyces pollinis-pini]|nr:hypothetical protein BC833DRAFT_600864 [Globomyces pollinis-pini]
MQDRNLEAAREKIVDSLVSTQDPTCMTKKSELDFVTELDLEVSEVNSDNESDSENSVTVENVEGQEIVDLAIQNSNKTADQDILKTLPAGSVYGRVVSIAKLSLRLCFTLLDTNMRTLYSNTSDLGWDEDQKWAEMNDPLMYYIILPSIGFTSFQYCMEDDLVHDKHCLSPMLYCYELQLQQSCKRAGWGSLLMNILETLAIKYNMKKIKLTVFKSNTSAIQFYQKLGFTIDCTCPSLHYSPKRSKTVSYYLYSKQL